MNKRPLHRIIDGVPCTLAQLDPDKALQEIMERIRGLSCLDCDGPVDWSWIAASIVTIDGEPRDYAFDEDELERRLRPVVEWLVEQCNANTNAYLADDETR